MIVRAAFFDLDGTLVDSLLDLTDAVNHIRGAFSLAPLTEDAVRLKVGKGARNLIEQVLPGHAAPDISRALNLFLEFNARHIADKSRLYHGIPETLDGLAARDIRMVVISNKHEELSRLILRELGIHDRFENICGGNTYPECKPSPLPLLKEAAKLGCAPFECVMVGDSINDIEAGKRANITAIACTWGYGSRDELAGADCFVHTPLELQAAITSCGIPQ
jgi:phosphoglycolate phosphatase